MGVMSFVAARSADKHSNYWRGMKHVVDVIVRFITNCYLIYIYFLAFCDVYGVSIC